MLAKMNSVSKDTVWTNSKIFSQCSWTGSEVNRTHSGMEVCAVGPPRSQESPAITTPSFPSQTAA